MNKEIQKQNSLPISAVFTFSPFGIENVALTPHPSFRYIIDGNPKPDHVEALEMWLGSYLQGKPEINLPPLTRISHKILDEDGQDVATDLPTMGREHCPSDKVRPIEGEDGVTDYSDSPRVCEKYGLMTLTLSSFTHLTLSKIKEIPFGTTISYEMLAVKCKRPRACRAVGTACGRNPWPLLIPCHRVIGKNGSIGGFSSGGILVKNTLLHFEQSFGMLLA